jgi:hypothetical protein
MDDRAERSCVGIEIRKGKRRKGKRGNRKRKKKEKELEK